MLALPWKRGFGEVITNIRDTGLSIFVKKEHSASDTKNRHLAVRPSCAYPANCAGMPADKNNDGIYNEPKDRILANVITYIRDEKELGHFHRYGPVQHSKDGSTKTQYIECSKRKRETAAKVEVVSSGLNIRMARHRLNLKFITSTCV